MKNIIISVDEYNQLLSKVKLLEKKEADRLLNLIKDKDFMSKIDFLNNFLNEQVTEEINEPTVTYNSAFTTEEFQKEIDKTREEINNGEFVTFEQLVDDLNDENL